LAILVGCLEIFDSGGREEGELRIPAEDEHFCLIVGIAVQYGAEYGWISNF